MARVLNGKAVNNMPWEECPKDCKEPIWRYSGNPVIKRHPVEGVARVFNSALVPFEDGFIGVFRGDGVDDIPHLYLGRSQDGINFKIDKDPIVFTNEKVKEWTHITNMIHVLFLLKIDTMLFGAMI